MRPLIGLRFGLGILLALSLAPNFVAQVAGRGSLSGLVTDRSGAAVAGAAVTLTDIDTGVAVSGRTSTGGLYSFLSLVPGTYQLTVERPGFKTSVQNKITIAVDAEQQVNMSLELGVVSEKVTVSAAPDIVATTSSTTGQVIPSAVIDRTPLLTRDIFGLVQLVPGVVPQDGNPTSLDSERNQVSNFTIMERRRVRSTTCWTAVR